MILQQKTGFELSESMIFIVSMQPFCMPTSISYGVRILESEPARTSIMLELLLNIVEEV
jgi:hypothetical protein